MVTTKNNSALIKGTMMRRELKKIFIDQKCSVSGRDCKPGDVIDVVEYNMRPQDIGEIISRKLGHAVYDNDEQKKEIKESKNKPEKALKDKIVDLKDKITGKDKTGK